MREKTLMIEGLHSKHFTNEVIDIMRCMNKDKYIIQYCESHISFKTTRGGDIQVYQKEAIDSKRAILFQEMDRDPWQDLAAMCTASAFLKKQGVKHVTVITPIWRLGHHDAGMPYLCDRIGTQKLVADILGSSAIERLVTLTPTADMLTDMYPLQVVQPDICEELKKSLRLSDGYPPVILALEESMLPLAWDLAQKLCYEAGILRISKNGSFASLDVNGRDILLYTHQLTDRLDNAVNDLRQKGCRLINCYLPWIDNPEYLKKDTEINWLITLETVHEFRSIPLYTGKILAEWIFHDKEVYEFDLMEG